MKEGKSKRGNYGELPVMSLVLGILFALSGITGKIFLGKGEFRIVSIEGSDRWILLLAGAILIALSIHFIRKRKFAPPAFTDDDLRQNKENLDQMYLREHEESPHTPEAPAPEPAPSPTVIQPTPTPAPPRTLTPEEEARIAKSNAKIRQGLLLILAGAAVFYVASGALLLIPAIALLLVGLTRLAVGLVERS